MKRDEKKLRWDLLPIEPTEEVVKAFMYGNSKPGNVENDWQFVTDKSNTYYAATMRHIVEWRKGNQIDESGCHHLAHACANLMIIMWGEIHDENPY